MTDELKRRDNHSSYHLYLRSINGRRSRLHEKLQTLTLKEKNEIETKINKALGTVQCFLARRLLVVAWARTLYQDLLADSSLHY